MLRIFIIYALVVTNNAIRNWDYTLIGVECEVKVDYFKSDMHAVRIKRGEYGVNGSITLEKDQGPNIKFQAKTYRSPRGNDDYKPMPFIMPKQKADTFFNNLYKNVMMDDLHKCANTPYFEGKWEGVLKAGVYEFNLCYFEADRWPDIMLPGFYKFVVEALDEEDNILISYIIIFELEARNLFGK